MISMCSLIVFLVILATCRSFYTSPHFIRHIPLRKIPQPLRNARINDDVPQFAERIESVKSGVCAAVAGSVAFAPYAILTGLLNSHPLNAQWEFSHDALALSLGLFGITYRYAVRNSTNSQLKYGVIGAFALTRILNMIHVPEYCTSLPLNCGFPFYYLSFSMVGEGLNSAAESGLAYFGAAKALDYCFDNKLINKFSGN